MYAYAWFQIAFRFSYKNIWKQEKSITDLYTASVVKCNVLSYSLLKGPDTSLYQGLEGVWKCWNEMWFMVVFYSAWPKCYQ
jgi:hypothetical protein